MSLREKDVQKDTNKLSAPRGNSPDRQSAHNTGSVESPSEPLLTSPSPTIMGDPPTENPINMPPISALPGISIGEVPQLVAVMGEEVAIVDSVWSEGPGLISSGLKADIPLRIIKEPQELKTNFPVDHVSQQVSTEGPEIGKESKIKCSPLTGIEVFKMFTQKTHLGGLHFYHLKTLEDGPYRPYDLHVVPCHKAGLDYYIFSPTSVIHVKDGSSVGLLKLTEWYREALLWETLKDIPFFRDYLLRKTFYRWRRNIRQASFQYKCKQLQSQLLMAVPQFRDSLFHLTRQIEELNKVHWLPQDKLNTYTLTEFQATLLTSNQHCRSSIEKFLHHCCLILSSVQESCHKTYQQLQQEMEEAQLKQGSQSLILQKALNRNRHKKLNHIVEILQKLGKFSALMDCMIVQNLVSITHSKLMSFLNKVLKRKQKNQGCLFQAELTFGEDGQIALRPSMHLFQELLNNALQSVLDSTRQVIEVHTKRSDPQDSLAVSSSFANDFHQPTPSSGFTNYTTVPVERAYQHHDSALNRTVSFPFEEDSCVLSNTNLVIPKRSSLNLESQRLQGQLYPLCIKQLEWHLHHHVGAQEIEKQQSSIIQSAFKEIQRLCENHSWLVDIYSFSSQWSSASVESMRGWPAPKYKEHIQIIQFWIEQVHNMPAVFTTSNKLITINCSPLQEMLEHLLNTIEEDILNLLSEELQFYATKLINDLNKCITGFKLEPRDLNEFANYARMVKCYNEIHMRQKLDDLCTFQKMNFGNLTSREVTLIEETFALWNLFVPVLRTAKERVLQQLPSMIDILDNTFLSLMKKLDDLVCCANSGPYRDLNQNSGQIIPKLQIKSAELYVIVSQLNELSEISQCLRGQPLDLSCVMTAKRNMEARKELWELIELSKTQIQDWKLIQFPKFVVSEAKDKLNKWLQQANSIAKALPSSDEMLQETLHVFEKFRQQLSLLDKLSSPTMKHKHWAQIFKDMDLLVAEGQELTVEDFTSRGLYQHENKITKICCEAKAEADMEQAFRRIQQIWEGTIFKLSKFDVYRKKGPQCEVLYLLDLEIQMAQAEDSVMTLSSMLFSPRACEFKREVEILIQLLQELVEILDFCKRYQQKWIFLSRIFYDMSMNTENVYLIEKFSQVDQMFHELIQAISCDPHMLNFVRLKKTRKTDCDFHGKRLRTALLKGLTLMEEICSQLLYLLDWPRCEFPRLCFLSDGEVIELLLLHLTPFSLLSTVRKCFRGVQWFEVDNNSKNDTENELHEPDQPSTQMWINGVYGSLMEYVPFVCPLKFNVNPVACLASLESCLHQTVQHLILKSIAARQEEKCLEQNKVEDNSLILDHNVSSNTTAMDEENSLDAIASSFLKLTSEYPLQCLLVAEEVLWHSEICNVLSSKTQNKWKDIKAQNTAKLQSLCTAIQNLRVDCWNGTKQHMVTALRAIILLIMKHSQQIAGLVDIKGSLESAFEWQTLMKYCLNATDKCSNVSKDTPFYSEDSVYIDILGRQLAYGNEYIGPENWMMVNTTSTERAHLGIVLCLTSYKCALISGPLMCGKQRTVHHLGWALGQQVITLKCCSNTSFAVVYRMLLGALQSGAWLVLSCVDLLEQGILSILGQCLTDIQQSLSAILENGPQNGLQFHSESEIKCLFGGKNVLAKPSYGCIIISSKGYSAEIPENLRLTTRPVSLMHPDYGVITEIMMISLGFSEATCISRRLISLLNLAMDSSCLPEFVCRDQCSWLVLLRKVIDVAAIYLYRQDEETHKEKTIEASENISQEYHKFTKKSSVANAIREEQALIKGIMSVLLSAISNHNRAGQFSTIFKEIFPAARYCPDFQYIIEQNERNSLRNAVTEELQQTAFYADSQILHNALSLHQALKFSKAVVIVGPAGSGKTTLYRALAGALRRLAATSAEEHVEDPTILEHSGWSSVDTVVLFPNALSHEELFGACYEETGTWIDGALTKVLRDAEKHSLPQITERDGPRNVKYLVLDGEPLACTKWFDFLSTFANPENPFLCLSSGENIHTSQEGLKILLETISLEDATPSSLSWCGLVYVSGSDLWKYVWKAEMEVLYRQHDLDKKTMKMWKCMADDIFSCTIIFLKHKGLTSVISGEEHEASKSDGLQEIMSFIKILYALLGESENEIDLKSACKQTRDPTLKSPLTELNARNLFLIAYIWGFGGQLHPRYWPQFDLFVREVLFKCRYKIEVPDTGTVFEHFFNLNDEALEDATMKNSGPEHSCTPVPQYKKYAYLMERLLEAHYPTLLVGEAGTGKTILCKTLIQKRPHLRIPINPLLNSNDLHNILEGIGSQKAPVDFLDSKRQHQDFFLFVDDLHESAIGKTSATLETLRQCISKGGVCTSESYHFKLFSSGAVSYLGTCRTLDRQKSYSQISPRLSRLFNILALPEMTADILYSFHSSQLQQWLKNFPPMPSMADMARCIVDTTYDVYLSVCEHLYPTAYSPSVAFTVYDLQKVFHGMCLFDSRTTAQHLHQKWPNPSSFSSPSFPAFTPTFLGPVMNILSIARLWMHECLHTFGDRLFSNEERQKLISFIVQASEKNFGSKLVTESRIFGEMPDARCQSESTNTNDINQQEHMTVQRDVVECIASIEESATHLPVVVVNPPESDCSEELSSSNSTAAFEKPHTISRPEHLLFEISCSIHNMVFGPEFSKLHMCRAQKFKQNIVYEERNMDVLMQQLTNIVKSKEEKDTCWKYAKFAVHHQRVRQLIHILRALLIPNGHGLLFGSAKKTGRKTAVRLAAYLTGYHLIEVHCDNEFRLNELLEDAQNQINMNRKHAIFLVHESISQTTRDELLVIMETWHHGEYIRPHISALLKKSPNQRIRRFNKSSKQRHIHVFFLLPLSQHTDERPREQSPVIARYINKALTLCYCIELYHPWSTTTLVKIASVHLKNTVDVNNLLTNIAQAMAEIHQSATKYASALSTISNQLISPQYYIELIDTFSHLFDHLCMKCRTHANRLETVLGRVNYLNDIARDYSQEIFKLKVKIQETQEELNQLQMVMDSEYAVCEQAHQQCLLEESCLSELQEHLDLAEKQVQDTFNEVTPLYKAALKALLSLNQSDIEEVRHYRQPPDGVVLLLSAICKLFNCPCDWKSVKHLFGQPDFVQELKFFDHSKINNELFEELGEIVHAPNFQTDLICAVSQACESLCEWVRAVYQYECVKRQLAPHEAHKDHVNNCMAEIRARLKVARLHKEAARERLEFAGQQRQVIDNKIKDLSAQLNNVEIKEKEVTFTIKQLSYYMEKWHTDKAETKMNDSTIPGDALLLAAAITYLGPFGPDIRLEMLKKWHKMCLTGIITVSPEDVRTSLLDETQFLSSDHAHSVQVPVAVALHASLSQALGWDPHLLQAVSPKDVLKLLLWGHRTPWAQKWTLLTDTQQYKECTSQEKQSEYSNQVPANAGSSEKGGEFELIVSAVDPEFIYKISHGAKKGLKVLVTEIEHAAPRDDFLSILNRPAGHHVFDVFDRVTPPHPEFCLCLSTSLPATILLEEIHPFILIKVKVIDLSLSTSEVEDIILRDLMKSNCSELWLRHCQLQKDKQVLQYKLLSEEDSLVEYILNSSTPLLQDPQLLPYVSLCQKASLKLEAGNEKLSKYLDENKAKINAFRCMTALATALYRAIQDVGRLYPFYFFPLCNFSIALRKTLALKGWSDATCSAVMVEGVGTSDILHRIVYHLFAHYRPYLYPKHAELLWMFFSVAFFIHTEECSEIEHIIFLKGLNDIESTVCSASAEQSASMLPNWIPTQTKADLALLEKLSSFHGLVSSLRNSSRQWQEYFRFPSATVAGTVPSQSHSQLTTLQRAILWKTFCPQWLAAVVDDFSACQQGQNIQSAIADNPHISSPEALLSFLSTNKCPVIVTMPSPTEIQTGSIHPLQWIKYFALHQAQMKGVKVVVLSFGSKCQRLDVLSSLNTAVQTGNWLVLNNCHLLDHWDTRVITQLKQIISCTGQGHWMNIDADTGIDRAGGDVGYVHQQFRLWFITKGSAPFSLPAFIRTSAMHLVIDSQWDLKDELYFSLRQVTSTAPPTLNVENPLYRCAILHSVLVQRQKLKQLGHGSIYKWSYDDLLALIDAYTSIAKQCHDPIGALEYVAVYLIYGGHVSDSADLEAVKSVCRVCLQPPLPSWGSGPHNLSKIISMTGHFDRDILKAVQHCTETKLNNNDIRLLGFNAEVEIDVVKLRSETLRNQLLQSQDSFAAVRHYDGMFNSLLSQTNYNMAQEALQALQTKIKSAKKDRSVMERKVSLSPIHTFLSTEWEILADKVSSLLETAVQPPQDPFTSPGITSSIISTLETRVNLLQMYQLEEYRDSLPVYCLSAFDNPRGFLAALIRETVHNRHGDVSNITLQFQALGAAASPELTPSDTIYLSGLELHGALWDKQLGALQDTMSPIPFPFPLLSVRTQETNCNPSDASQSSPSNSYAIPLYNCPLYLDSHSEDGVWSLSVNNIVTHVPLMTTLDPVLCKMRRVRLVSTLKDNKL